MKYAITLTLLLSTILSFGQLTKAELKSTRQYLKANNSQPQMRLPGRNQPLNDSIQAIAFAHELISDTYPAYFEKQKPYRIASYKNYWFIRGTVTGIVLGRTIVLILDKRNSDVVLLSQEK